MYLRILKADKGRILVNGQQVGKDCDFPDSLGVIIETPGFIPDISGYQNLKILADLKGRIGKQEIRDTIRRVGLDPKIGSRWPSIRSVCGKDSESHRQSWRIRRF